MLLVLGNAPALRASDCLEGTNYPLSTISGLIVLYSTDLFSKLDCLAWFCRLIGFRRLVLF
jgi:hypothetical protein